MSRTKQQPLKIEHVPIGEFHPDPFNPRRISDAELEAAGSPLGASLPNTTRESCFMARSRPGAGQRNLWRLRRPDGRQDRVRIARLDQGGGGPGIWRI